MIRKRNSLKFFWISARSARRKYSIIPTDDHVALALARTKPELEKYYHLPVPSYETVSRLVNKKSFYHLLADMQVPYPETYFPETTEDLLTMGREMAFPYIIKPVYSLEFQREFGRKCFIIRAQKGLEKAVRRLETLNPEVMLQEIVPGKSVYTFLTYMNRASEPLAVCGWDKLRHYPPSFGNGSFCESVYRAPLIEQGLKFLRDIGYQGFAAPEFKIDPHSKELKMLEVNPRTTLANGLAAACGVDIGYAAYLDAYGYDAGEPPSQRNGVLWGDDFIDIVSFAAHLKRGEIDMGDIRKAFKPRNVHSVFALDDPLPFIALGCELGYRAFSRLIGR